jgi:hypothetical protein
VNFKPKGFATWTERNEGIRDRRGRNCAFVLENTNEWPLLLAEPVLARGRDSCLGGFPLEISAGTATQDSCGRGTSAIKNRVFRQTQHVAILDQFQIAD